MTILLRIYECTEIYITRIDYYQFKYQETMELKELITKETKKEDGAKKYGAAKETVKGNS